MSPLFVILLVLFTLVLGAWGLILFGAISSNDRASSVLAWLACLLLGIVVFLAGTGVLVVRPY